MSLLQRVVFVCWALVCAAAIATPTVTVRADKSTATRHVLLQWSFDAGSPSPFSPWIAAADSFNSSGVAVAVAQVSTELRGRRTLSLAPSEMRAEIRSAMQEINAIYPSVPVHLAGFGTGAGLLLDAAADIKEIDRVLLASGDFRVHRMANWSAYKHPVMVLHAPSAQCDFSPYLEAEQPARSSGFSLVQMGYDRTEPEAGCGQGSQHSFATLEPVFAAAVTQWLDGGDAPNTIAYTKPSVAWQEQLLRYQAPANFGTNTLEMTLMLPVWKPPFPVAVFNHGDIDRDSPYVRYKARFLDSIVAKEFLRMGWAIAFPARRGVNASEGQYPRHFHVGDGDATYKARILAMDILPAIDHLKSFPNIDRNRILITGQSAGGYAAMHIASMNPPGVAGAVNFSVGRTDKVDSGPAGHLNTTMVRGFAEFGTSTRIPMLWIFSENDSRYSANTIRASHQAFTEAGGKATLLLSAPLNIDGHFIHARPALWRQVLRDYLGQLAASPANQSSDARVFVT
jgi:dienelactone hydrolase